MCCCVLEDVCEANPLPLKCGSVVQVWKATVNCLTTIGHQWRPTGRLLPLGDQWPLTRNTPPKVLPTKQWKPIGRLLPLGRKCHLVRSTTLKSLYRSFLVLDSGCSTTYDWRSLWSEFSEKFICGLFDSETTILVQLWDTGIMLLVKILKLPSGRKAQHAARAENLDSVDLIKGSRGFTWVKFLRSKDETPVFVINLLKQLQVETFRELLSRLALLNEGIRKSPLVEAAQTNTDISRLLVSLGRSWGYCLWCNLTEYGDVLKTRHVLWQKGYSQKIGVYVSQPEALLNQIVHHSCLPSKESSLRVKAGTPGMLYAATTSNTPGLNTSTSDIISSREQVEKGGVELYFVENRVSTARIYSLRHCRERF
ncbi:hypothetical protein Tco_0486984 [Tanacetum coccineum]